ncbi:MAG: hypothetical protein ABSF29_16870, partial [Tepidisphaeraceae bacterium]
MPVARFRGILAPLLVAGIISGVYAIAAWSNQFVYDDHEVIENQYPIRHLNDLGRIFAEPHYLNFPYYRPVTRATFALQMSVWGRNPLAYHLFNSILAGAVVLAAYGLVRRPGIGLSPPAALMAAGWFGLHPAFSECVYPAASGRETLLSALMIVLTTWAYLGRGLRWYLGAMILFAIALLSKEQAAVLPGIFVLADVLGIAQKPAKLREWILKYLPVAVIFCLYFFVRHLIFRQPTLQVTLFEHPLDPLKSLLYGLQTA